MTIVKEILKLRRPAITNPEYDCKAAEVAIAVCQLFAEIILADESENDRLDEFAQLLSDAVCEASGHSWELDHCGYWGHAYCRVCRKAKYPELARLSCGEANAKIGRVTESTYLEMKEQGMT